MKILIKTILAMSLVSLPAVADVTDDEPLIVNGNVTMFEGTEDVWVKFSDKDFDIVDKYTTLNNLRKKHNIAKIKAYGIDNNKFANSDSELKKSFYDDSMSYANKYFKGKDVTLYCTLNDYAGFLHCLVFREVENKLGETTRIGYNVGIIESGLSDFKFPYSSDEDNATKVDNALLHSKRIAENNKLGIWSLKFNFLPDDF